MRYVVSVRTATHGLNMLIRDAETPHCFCKHSNQMLLCAWGGGDIIKGFKSFQCKIQRLAHPHLPPSISSVPRPNLPHGRELQWWRGWLLRGAQVKLLFSPGPAITGPRNISMLIIICAIAVSHWGFWGLKSLF